MALEAAFLELRDGLKRLAAQLQQLQDRVRDGCPDEAHCVAVRLNDSVPVLAGWLRKSRKQVRTGSAALAAGDLAAARRALSASERSLEKLRRDLRRELTRRDRLLDLADLRSRKPRTWGPWVDEVLPALREVRKQEAAVRQSLSQCWKELAAQTQPGLTITSVGIGIEVVEPRKDRLGGK